MVDRASPLTSTEPHGATPCVPTDLFVAYFRSAVRVQFAWEQMLQNQWAVRVSIIDTPAALADWYLPWYLDARNREVSFRTPGAQPIRLDQFARVEDFLSIPRREAIEQLRQTFIALTEPVHLVIPLYSLGNSSGLVLDGSHRLAALVTTRCKFKIMTFTVEGPLSNAVVPDIVHWERPPAA